MTPSALSYQLHDTIRRSSKDISAALRCAAGSFRFLPDFLAMRLPRLLSHSPCVAQFGFRSDEVASIPNPKSSIAATTIRQALSGRCPLWRFRRMLREGNFALSQRDMIEQLVIEEEAKFTELMRQPA